MSESPNKFLYWVLVASAVNGSMKALLPPDSRGPLGALTLPYGIVCSVLYFCWCKAHSRAFGITAPASSATLCGFVAAIGVPLYFFRAFGLKRGLVGTIKAMGFFMLNVIIIAAANGLSAYIAYNNSLHLTAALTRRESGGLSRQANHGIPAIALSKSTSAIICAVADV